MSRSARRASSVTAIGLATVAFALLPSSHEAGAQIVRDQRRLTPAPASADPGVMPGEYAFKNAITNEYLSAAAGTLRASKTLGANERLRLSRSLVGTELEAKRIQTSSGGFVTASGEIPPAITFSSAPPDDATSFNFTLAERLSSEHLAGAYVMTSLKFKTYSIAQPRLVGKPPEEVRLLNSVGGSSYFWVTKCGELGPSRTYSMRAAGTTELDLKSWRFLRQQDGTYAIYHPPQRAYYAARDGGGLSPGRDPIDVKKTLVPSETWTPVDQGDCTYALRTSKGWYLGAKASAPLSGSAKTTRISDPNAAPSIGYIAKFELVAADL